ncbi:uncharacterized protein LOC111044738 [Nilaparvata lugens]|uniref:uncharacterized protein LOC111044738 n=1 Tax=Nilaparvata lugens TaxID=108931 RepID=UPI00193D2653|nr:uncharacterized protein LOC111044738 [Nilaparvata lugens]
MKPNDAMQPDERCQKCSEQIFMSECAYIMGPYKCLVESLRGMRILASEAVLRGQPVFLSCDYDLEDASLYSIKWYLNDQEFYRYVPKESPPTRVFALPGLHVDVSNSDSHGVMLLNASRPLTGQYKCEVSADAPLFHTDIRSTHLTVVGMYNFI